MGCSEGDQEAQKDAYGNYREVEDIKFANRLGMESHTPVNRDSYRQKQMHTQLVRDESTNDMVPKRDARGRIVGIENDHGSASSSGACRST